MMTDTPNTVLASTARIMTASQSGRTYRITISLPLGYARTPHEPWPFNRTPDLWPVVYVLDGNWYSGLITEIVRPMAWCGSTTDAIVVGIGYEEGHDAIASFRESFIRRNYDLTPVRDEAEEQSMEAQHKRPVPSGDAAGFLAFIRDDLMPLIESEYRADPARRILVGHSYGGLFGLFSLFEAPGLFSHVIMGSPTMSYGSRIMFQREAEFAATHTALPVQVSLFVGEHEEDAADTTLTDTLRLAALLQGRGYAGFSLVKHVFLDQNHCEVAAPGFQWGLKSALRR